MPTACGAEKPMHRKKSYLKRVELLKSERSSFIPLYRELSDYCLASRGRFLTSDRNKGHKRNTKQINNETRRAARTLASGMMAGITSPARPWFKLGLADIELGNDAAVKAWLLTVEKIMREIFNQSNTYRSLHNVYQELGVFGTASMGVYENYDNVIRCKPYTVGSYMLANNGEDEVDTWAREYQLTVQQLVEEFGYENCSDAVRTAWNNGNTTAWYDVIHIIERNDNRDAQKPLAKFKRFRSIYFEKACQKDRFLRESGFDDFPIMAPRWEVTGEDVYGTDCPGIMAIGDTKALQLSETQKYEGIERRNTPHMIAPSSLRNVVAKGLPANEISFVDNVSAGDGIRPAYQFNPQINDHILDIQQVSDRINKTFYVDLFLMLANSDRRQITAREVAERHEEKLLMLGPVLERLHNELLDPLIDRVFNIGMKAGIFGTPPEQLLDQQIKVEYISILAQAQRMVATNAINDTASFVANISQVWPEARHKLKPDKMIDDYADATGVSPDIISTKDEYEAKIAAEQQQAQFQQRIAAGSELADGAKTLSEIDPNADTGLSSVMQRMGLA